MKRVWWISGCLVVFLAVLAMSTRLRPGDHSNAKANIVTITNLSGIQFVDKQEWSGSRVLGEPIEHRLRGVFGSYPREEPFHLVEHRFRDAGGDFSIEIWDSEGRVFNVVIRYSKSGVSEATIAALKKLFPDAEYHPKP